MSSSELEYVLSLRDVNVGTSQKRLRAEIIEFIQRHEDAVLAQLRTHESAVIPTSFGEITLNLADLHEAIA
jgi:nitroimidazol reductase NimA-like FMN-containing flavoprotein (pyridoxamine 5'-phosphate oxidase superfamily)